MLFHLTTGDHIRAINEQGPGETNAAGTTFSPVAAKREHPCTMRLVLDFRKFLLSTLAAISLPSNESLSWC